MFAIIVPYFFVEVRLLKRLAVTALITLAIPVFAGCVFAQSETVPEDTALTPNATIDASETSQPLTPTPTSTPTPTPTPAPERINISFIGDCTLADALAWSGTTGSFDAVVEEEGLDYCFQNAVPYLSEDDLTLANFEGTITEETSHLIKEFVFSGPPEYVEMLTGGSIEAVNLANNHSYDYYEQGLLDTQAA
ncbi:MAG: CapA family protein, partial [Clostridiales bacterium]|nr:CapA family protein [Clostridiales bacterium]